MSIGPGLPGAVMEAIAEGFACGQVGTLTVTIDDGEGNNVVGPTTAGIIELECSADNFGVYRYLGVYPSDAADSPYVITWEGPSASDPDIDTTATEEIFVSDELIAVPSAEGPCTDWITGEDVAACCSVEVSSDSLFDEVATSAQNLLFKLSGGLYVGLCGPVTVRPCTTNCGCFPAQRLAYASGGSRVIWTGTYWGNGSSRNCGCGCLPRVLLSGYPVQIITEVKIDGAVVAPSDYRIDEYRFLTRLNGDGWPSCQDLSLEDTEEGTFSVSYGYGASPPQIALDAAAALACEFYKDCQNDSTCVLPRNTVRVARTGVTIDMTKFGAAYQGGKWQTGIGMVDFFLNSSNPSGLPRRPTVWAPGERYARPVG